MYGLRKSTFKCVCYIEVLSEIRYIQVLIYSWLAQVFLVDMSEEKHRYCRATCGPLNFSRRGTDSLTGSHLQTRNSSPLMTCDSVRTRDSFASRNATARSHSFFLDFLNQNHAANFTSQNSQYIFYWLLLKHHLI